jgi:hypothetical protein
VKARDRVRRGRRARVAPLARLMPRCARGSAGAPWTRSRGGRGVVARSRGTTVASRRGWGSGGEDDVESMSQCSARRRGRGRGRRCVQLGVGVVNAGGAEVVGVPALGEGEADAAWLDGAPGGVVTRRSSRCGGRWRALSGVAVRGQSGVRGKLGAALGSASRRLGSGCRGRGSARPASGQGLRGARLGGRQ